MKGKVKWFDNKKGYGFIEANGTEYFAHYKEIQADGYRFLTENQVVEFDPSVGDKGPKALTIEPVG